MRREQLRQFENLMEEIKEERARLRRAKWEADEIAETVAAYSLFAELSPIAEAEKRVAENMRRYETELASIRIWIESVSDSITRRAFKLRFLDGHSWGDVARRMGYQNESSPRSLCERYLQNKAG